VQRWTCNTWGHHNEVTTACTVARGAPNYQCLAHHLHFPAGGLPIQWQELCLRGTCMSAESGRRTQQRRISTRARVRGGTSVGMGMSMGSDEGSTRAQKA
jgi:hypothetical protein